MKNIVNMFLNLLRLILIASLIGHLSAAKIHAQENILQFLPHFARLNPAPTPAAEKAKETELVLPENTGTWSKFKYSGLIANTAQKYNLDPQLIYATIMTESEGDEYAYRYEPHLNEPSLCMGQILVSTARSLGFTDNVRQMYDPDICIDLIGKYYKRVLDEYGYLTPHQLARAYNTGSPWGRAVWGHISRFSMWFYEQG